MAVPEKLSRFACVAIAMALAATPASGQSTLGDLAQRAAALRPVPGDRVLMTTYGDPSMNGASIVDERGRIMLPRVGMIQADAFTAAALRDTIRARATLVLREPTVDVTVQRRIIVSGEVLKPGVYYADLTSSFGEMVAQAGGLRETGNPGKVYLVRGSTQTRIADWASDQSPNPDLHSADQILVGRKSWMELNIIPFASLTMSAISLAVYIREALKK
jgi:polysaccharide export outer membrane protein